MIEYYDFTIFGHRAIKSHKTELFNVKYVLEYDVWVAVINWKHE